MNSIQIIQSLLKADLSNSSQGITFRPGQLIHGRVEKLFPNQTALLQIGSMKMYAHIDVAIVAMERYWFEAQSSQSGELRLKVLDTEVRGMTKTNEIGTPLLTKFQLPDTKINQQLVKFLLSKDLAFQGEHLTNASKWLASTPDLQKGLAALELIIKKELPPTTQTFKSLVAFQSSGPIASQIDLLAKLLSDPQVKQTETIQQLRVLLPRILGEITEEQGEKVVREVSKLWLSSESTVSEQNASLRILQKLELLPKNYTLEQSHQSLIKQLNIELPAPLSTFRLNSNNLALLVDSFIQSVSNYKLKSIPAKINELVHNSPQILGETELVLFKQVQKELLPQTFSFGDGSEVKQFLKQMTNLMGLGYEKNLDTWAKFGTEAIEKFDSLKPLLIKAMGELGLNGRELEPLLNRITGLQLISQESNGPLQQLFMQFPLSLGDKMSDITLQWSGRKRKDGQIDPSFCRILFYLDLQNIQQTVIDMNVQNRIIYITIINNTEGIESSVTNQQIELKDQLNSLDYILSSVKVVASSFAKNGADSNGLTDLMFSQGVYQGVDFKV